jgi:subtilisin family serine protease
LRSVVQDTFSDPRPHRSAPLPLSQSYSYAATGAGVNIYIIDTGLQSSHPEFGGRARNVATAFGDNGEDCNGHGTLVAGTAGGTTYGVAEGARLLGVKILDCSGTGTLSAFAAGADWVYANRIDPAVANMSLQSSTPSQAVNTAVNRLVNSGVFVAVAAGNYNMNACNSSPASASAAFTTAASTKTDVKASFSNWGSCVDGYAPGDAINSARLGGGAILMSGTSMASPHVAGVAALLKQLYGNLSSSAITSWIKHNSTANRIQGNVIGTPNRLLFKGAL